MYRIPGNVKNLVQQSFHERHCFPKPTELLSLCRKRTEGWTLKKQRPGEGLRGQAIALQWTENS